MQVYPPDLKIMQNFLKKEVNKYMNLEIKKGEHKIIEIKKEESKKEESKKEPTKEQKKKLKRKKERKR